MSGFVSLRLAIGAVLMSAAVLFPQSTTFTIAAAAQGAVTLGPSGLPLPRFVSLKSGRVNSRIGPGLGYSVDWMYMKSGLPMEIIQEYDNWRRVRDADGSEGWINQSLLSGKRTAIVAPWQRGKETQVNLLASGDKDARVIAMVEPGAIGTIRVCNGQWCEMTFDGRNRGWISQSLVWGAYPGETIED
ncbi:SH3 domain-containing protein [Corticibacterium sp. UT-5YL-CI-8]|nr:SH3 domain-containing protein [Tianweitania sp. UT-5YL-CI-8]